MSNLWILASLLTNIYKHVHRYHQIALDAATEEQLEQQRDQNKDEDEEEEEDDVSKTT